MLSFDISDRQINIVKGDNSSNKIRIERSLQVDIPEDMILNGEVINLSGLSELLLTQLKAEDIEKITQEMRKYFEYIIIDTSAGINGSVFDIVTNSDLILIVTTPDPVCVRDARMMSDEFYKRGNQKQRLVINKANKRIFEFDEMDDLDAIIDTVGVQLLGVIPEDSAIPLATGKGAPLSSSSMGFLAFSAISRRIKGEHIPLSIKV